MLALAGCVVDSGPRTVGELTSRERTRAAQLYSPTRGPVALADAGELEVPTAPVKAVVYVPECASPQAPPDHVAYFQSLGLAVAIPHLGGDLCVVPTDRLGTVHNELERLATALASVPWIDGDGLYLVGHGSGADVASTYTREEPFKGLIGLAAACPFGIQNVTPMLTFRALDDPVLANRGTRCTEFQPPNAMHLEFTGRDHTMRLHDVGDDQDARRLMRNAIARFIDAGAPVVTVAERDAADVEQLGSAEAAGAEPEAAPAATAEGEDAAVAEDGALAEEPAAEPGPAVAGAAAGAAADPAETETATPQVSAPPPDAPPAAAEAPPPPVAAEAPAEPATADVDVLYLPSLNLPPGRF